MSDEQAMEMSRLMSEAGAFPEIKQDISKSLFDYYRQILATNPLSRSNLPSTRRAA